MGCGYATPVRSPLVSSTQRVFDVAAPIGLFVALLLVPACSAEHVAAAPTIEFTTVPEGMEGGPELLTTIAGRVTGARQGQRIVVFAKSGTWWVQPYKLHPFTSIGSDATWKTQTHYGFEYAALLVDASYQPPATLDALPAPGGSVLAVASVKGVAQHASSRRILQFSGYEWEVRQSVSERGGINPHDPANAWVDDQGLLHLRIARRDAGWTSAEVKLTRSLGYGTYMFVVRDVGDLEPAAVFSMFTWDESAADPNHRELDIEISRWGDPKNKNAQFVVQPYHVPANVVRFSAPNGVLTHSFRWEAGRVLFKTMMGPAVTAGARPIFEHQFTSGVPVPGTETIRLSTYVNAHLEHPLQNGAEVVVEKFVYLP
jgi:hypothetical protein